MEKLGGNCFVCGNEFCEEDADHMRITSFQFYQLLKQRAGFYSQIAHLKFKIQKAFRKLEKKTGMLLNHYQEQVMLFLDKLHFWDLMRYTTSLKDIEAAIFGFMIPKKQLIRLITLLKTEKDVDIIFPNFHLLFTQVHEFKKNARTIIQENDYARLMVSFSQIINQAEKQFNKKCFAKHTRQITNGDVLGRQEEGTDFILIEGIPFSTSRSSLDLSMLQINNKTLMKYLPSLEKIRNLKELFLRNTRLTKKGFQIILSQFPKLETLDLSSSPSLEYMEFLGKLCPYLKTLYINYSQLTNDSLLELSSTLPNLRVIFADGNEITNEGVSAFFKSRPNIVFMSFKNNRISQEMGIKLQVNMAFNGGYMEF